MTTAHDNDKWYSIYVPGAPGTVATHESYLRLGSPDVAAESAFLNTLKQNYASAAAQVAVQAAFGRDPTGGIVFYTEGDVLQFVNGRSDTRVLNDSYIVHVLNKADVDAAASAPADKPLTTYRTYLRLGKPHPEIEASLSTSIAEDKITEYAKALAPAAPAPITTATATTLKTNILAGVVNDGTTLATASLTGDGVALDALEALRTDGDLAATSTPYANMSSVNAWALAQLQAAELQFANLLRDQAMLGDATARQTLADRAKVGDPVVRLKLVEITASSKVSASTSYKGLPTAIVWANQVIATLPKGSEAASASWTLGTGISMFSDQAITATTPSTLKVTVGADSRSVLGPTYTETYDVDDDTLEKIRQGSITKVGDIASKKLITASLTARSIPFWRTTKFDQSKSLSYSMTDSGSFSLSSSYGFSVGLKLTNGISASFDASAGVSASVPKAFKVELNDQRTETSWTGGKCDYKDSQDLRGRSLSLTTDLVQTAVQPGFATFAKFVRVSMVVVNAAAAAYTAAVIAIGNTTTEDSSGPTANIRDVLAAGEDVYMAATVLNAVFLAMSLVAGVIQLQAKLAADAAAAVSPVQPPNVLINKSGIKLQCGGSYISIDATGVAIYGPQVYLASPVTSVVPAYLLGNFSPPGAARIIEIAEQYAADLASGEIWGDGLIRRLSGGRWR